MCSVMSTIVKALQVSQENHKHRKNKQIQKSYENSTKHNPTTNLMQIA